MSRYDPSTGRQAEVAFLPAIDQLFERVAARLDPNSAEAQGVLEVERCRESFDYWIDAHGWLYDPKRKVDDVEHLVEYLGLSERELDELNLHGRHLPFTRWPVQRELSTWFLDGYDKGDDRVLNKAREIGATWLALHCLWWLWRFEPGFSALLLSRVEKKVDDGSIEGSLFGKLRFINDMQPPGLKVELTKGTTDTYLTLENPENGARLVGQSTTNEVGRSERYAVVFADEFARVHPSKQREIATSLETVARSQWLISTPNGRGDEFYAAWWAAPKGNRRECDWRTNPIRTEAWFKGLLRKNGGRLTWDQRAQEHACDWGGVSGVRVFKASQNRITYTDDDLPANSQHLFWIGGMDFGSGPSWTVFLLALVEWHNGVPHLWIEREIVWQRVAAEHVASEIIGKACALDDAGERMYSEQSWTVGDPAGVNAESDQSSWESRLRSYGVPLYCLPAEYNSPDMIDLTIGEVQDGLASGLIRVHERCVLVLETIAAWEYDVPANMPLELISRGVFKPKKNKWSHPGDALRYLVGAANRLDPKQAERIAKVLNMLPPGANEEIGEAYQRVLDGTWG